MTTKEATVFIVDLGATMGARRHGRAQTDLDWALEYVWDRLTTIVATGRKTNLAGIIGLRTDGTDNILGEEEHYRNVSVLQPLDQILMPQLRELRELLQVSQTEAGDAVSAIVIAVQMILEKCKKLQYVRRIILITDARAPMLTDDLPQIRKKIAADKIELTILGVDFDDAEYGYKEEAKDPIKEENETILRTLCEDCGGAFGTIGQAIEEIAIPRIKSTRPIASFKGLLTLGNPSSYETAMTIDVERYPKIMLARPPNASSFVLREGLSVNDVSQSLGTTIDDGSGNQDGGDLTAVRNARTYQVVDEEAPGRKRDVAREELAKGYEYGRTAVHISESDRNVTTYETQQGLDIIGFVAKSQVRAPVAVAHQT
jgi:ATP-dependent DNA helicase 2 subunit 2